MTIYDVISSRLAVFEEVKVTCILNGKGVCRELMYPQADYPIRVDFERRLAPAWYSKYGGFLLEGQNAYPALALGHFDTQIATAQAIADQAFDTEEV